MIDAALGNFPGTPTPARLWLSAQSRVNLRKPESIQPSMFTFGSRQAGAKLGTGREVAARFTARKCAGMQRNRLSRIHHPDTGSDCSESSRCCFLRTVVEPFIWMGYMAVIQVEIEQFKWDGNALIHSPTGATFSWRHSNSRTGEVITEWKSASDVLSSGDEFDPSEIDILARTLMKEYEGL